MGGPQSMTEILGCKGGGGVVLTISTVRLKGSSMLVSMRNYRGGASSHDM